MQAKETETRWKSNGQERFVYDNQIRTAIKIVEAYKGKYVVMLIAQMQMGKTGVVLYVAYLMCMNEDDKKVIDPANVYIITGLSDNEWKQQTMSDSFPMFKNVYHRGNLRRFRKKKPDT